MCVTGRMWRGILHKVFIFLISTNSRVNIAMFVRLQIEKQISKSYNKSKVKASALS